MKNRLIIFLAIATAILGCKSDSAENELEEVEFVNDEQEDLEDFSYYDSLITYSRNEWIESDFIENQFDPNSNYCYAYDNLLVYSDTAGNVKKGRLDLGEKVEIVGFVKKTEEVVTLTGNYVKIERETGETGYVYDGYLLSLPYPDKGTWGFVDYGLSKLRIIDSAHFEGAYYGNGDEVYETDNAASIYPFENNITISSSDYYEGGSDYMELSFLTVKEGLIFMDALSLNSGLIDLMNGELWEGDYEIDTDDSDEYSEGVINIQYSEDGQLKSIDYFIGEGCGDWFEVRRTETGIHMTIGGGC